MEALQQRILAEGRKYRLVVTIATQTMNQLPQKSLAAVFGNCATIIIPPCFVKIKGIDSSVPKSTLSRDMARNMRIWGHPFKLTPAIG